MARLHTGLLSAIAMSFFVSGCSDAEKYAWSASDAHCVRIAKQRADDAVFSGEDAQTQKVVYDTTRSQCVAWDLTHGTEAPVSGASGEH